MTIAGADAMPPFARASALTFAQRVIRADAWRKTRFHDIRGNFVGVRGLATDLPRAAIGALARETLDYRPTEPWVPYPAIRQLQRILRPEWRVLEYGAGMSTLWWARRVSFVHSIEIDPAWHAKVLRMLQARGLRNVQLDLRTQATHVDLSDEPDNSFDLVVVDGPWRDESVPAAIRVVKRPGYMYLDNTDFGALWDMYADAESALLQNCNRADVTARYFTGFPPATFVATQGVLVEWH